MRKQFSIASFVCLPLLACGGNDNKTVKVADAKTFKDAPAAVCGAEASYASLGNMGYALDLPAHTGSNGSAVPRAILAGTTLGSGDVASGLLLAAGGGVFPTTINPGTYPITGDDASFATCNMCFFIQAGAVNKTANTIGFKLDGTGGDFYEAVSGSITLTAVGSNAGSGSGHHFAGTISNVTFKKIDVNTGDPTADGCTSSAGSGGWGYDLQNAGSAALVGGEPTGRQGIDGVEMKLTNRTL